MEGEVKEDNSGPAFPGSADNENDYPRTSIPTRLEFLGMTRRQWLAGLAMQGILSFQGGVLVKPDKPADVAVKAYAMADAMLRFEAEER